MRKGRKTMMKKLMAVLLAMMLMMAGSVLAQELALYDFDDFTIEMEDDIVGELYEKVDGQEWFIVFPEYNEQDDFNANVNCVWGSECFDLNSIDAQEMADVIAQEYKSMASSFGITCNEAQVLETEYVTVDGVIGLRYLIFVEYDYSDMGYDMVTDLYQRTYQFSLKNRGTYTFSLSAEQLDMIEKMDAMIESIRWN